MVKPSKTMQPEFRTKPPPGRSQQASSSSFASAGNSFHDYMARKIQLQRQQMGLSKLPPPPPRPPSAVVSSRIPPSLSIHFGAKSSSSPSRKRPRGTEQNRLHDRHDINTTTTTTTTTPDTTASPVATPPPTGRTKGSHSPTTETTPVSSISSILQRLVQKHGTGSVRIQRRKQRNAKRPRELVDIDSPRAVSTPSTTTTTTDINNSSNLDVEQCKDDHRSSKPLEEGQLQKEQQQESQQEEEEEDEDEEEEEYNEEKDRCRRPDLFFWGVVIKVNGYTDPDSESLKRMIQKYGGDYETYETSRVTHLVAETLSKAKVDHYTTTTTTTSTMALSSSSHKRPRLGLKLPIVQPTWILDSIEAQRLLPWEDYTCTAISVQLQPTNQRSLREMMFLQPKTMKAMSTTLPPQPQPLSASTIVYPSHSQRLDLVASSSLSSRTEQQQQQPITQAESSHLQIVPPSKTTCMENEGVSTTHTKEDNQEGDRDSTPSTMAGMVNDHECPSRHSPVKKNNVESTSPSDKKTATFNALAAEEEGHTRSSPSTVKQQRQTDSKYIHGRIRTCGTDPHFLDSFFANSRLSYIGSYQQRTTATAATTPATIATATKRASNPVQPMIPASVDGGAGNLQKFVFHVDMDCFFANVVLRKYPQYRDQPVVISHLGKSPDDCQGDPKLHHSVKVSSGSTSECATCNYHARTFGIKKGMFLGRAKQLCPNVIVLPYDFDGYEEVSEQVLSILHRVAAEWDGHVEAVSCDEAYIQVSLPAMPASIVDQESPTTNIPPEDCAGRLAEAIREEILETTQCTASIGVAANKFLAKVGTDRVKPNGTFVVKDYRSVLESLRLRDLHGIGYRSEPRLAAEGLDTVQDVWDLGSNAESILSKILGPSLGKKIYRFCHGKDDREVKAVERKTIGAECNYGVRFDGPYGIDHFVTGLATEVSRRMEKLGYKGSKLTLKVKKRKDGAKPPPKFLGHGSCHNLSKSMDLPAFAPTRSAEVLADAAMNLFGELDVPLDDVRGMGMIVSKLAPDSATSTATNMVPSTGIASFFQGCVEPKSPSRMVPDDGDENSSYRGSEALVLKKKSRPSSPIPDLEEEDHTAEENHQRHVSDYNDVSVPIAGTLPPLLFQGTGTSPLLLSQGNLALPPLSQICMSQVAALPQGMQDEIRSRLTRHDQQQQQRPRGINGTEINPILVDLSRDLETSLDAAALDTKSYHSILPPEKQSYRQINLKRLLKLAAVKSGGGSSSLGAGGFSVEDFQALPLEIQLQIANGDHGPLGLLSPKPPTRPNKGNAKKVGHSSHARSSSSNNTHDRAAELPPEDTARSCIEEGQSTNSPSLPVDLFDDDIVPLNQFLNDNSPSNPDALEMVHAFFRTCLVQHRMNALRPLLQSIRMRNDDVWSRDDVLMEIGRVVDETHFELYHKRLDVNWLIGRG